MPLIHRILVVSRGGAASDTGMAQATALARTCDAQLQHAARDGDVAVAARAFGADLLVMAAPCDPQSQRLRLGPADWEILRASPCPVLLTRAGMARPYREILVAVDPMHSHDKPAALDDALIAGARALADATARIGLVHCHLPPEYVPLRAPGVAHGALFHRRESSLDAHRAALQELAHRHGMPESAVRLEPGDPREAIPDIAASVGADLVVLGAMARSRIGRFLIGSTTEPVLGRLACDALAVKLMSPSP